jgi:hypothetical protein
MGRQFIGILENGHKVRKQLEVAAIGILFLYFAAGFVFSVVFFEIVGSFFN